MDRADIVPSLAQCLVHTQFPHWAGLPIRPVDHGGWDNTTFRLGDDFAVRLPSAHYYVAQVEKEHRWLPYFAERLPLPIPRLVAKGEPGCGYPWPWSVYAWLPGGHATVERVADLSEFARSLATFLTVLYAQPTDGGPPAGQHNFFRGASPAVYDEETRATVAYLGDAIDGAAAIEAWDAALAAPFDGPPVWFHGDLSASNLLVHDGRLSAVIDFGTIGVGDPACDLAIAWTFFAGKSRRVFRDTVRLDDGAWARGRGWTLWKALITYAKALREHHDVDRAGLRFGWSQSARDVIEDVLADHRASLRT